MVKKIPSAQLKIPRSNMWGFEVFEGKFMVSEFLISGNDWFLLKQTDFPTQWTFWKPTMMDFRWLVCSEYSNLIGRLKIYLHKIKTDDLTVRMYKSGVFL